MTTSLDDLMDTRDLGEDNPEGSADDFLDDDAFAAPARTSRLTVVLVALLILVVGFLLGVLVQRAFG